MKKIIMVGLIGMLGAVGAQAGQNFSIADGNWASETTWSTAYLPSYAHWTYVQDAYTVTVDSYAETDWLQVLSSGSLVLDSGADLQLLSGTQRVGVNGSSTLTVNTGAQLSTGYLMIADSAGNTGTAIVNGGTANVGYIFVGEGSAGHNAAPNLQVNGGLLQSPNALIFGGGLNSVANVNLTGGRLEIPYISYNGANNGQTDTLTVDGGELAITTTNPNGSLGFYYASQQIFLEDGSMIWEGVNTVEEFNIFADTFNGWVDSGNLTSANWTAAELKASLYFDGSDAVAAIPEPGTLGLVAIFGGALVCVRRLKI